MQRVNSLMLRRIGASIFFKNNQAAMHKSSQNNEGLLPQQNKILHIKEEPGKWKVTIGTEKMPEKLEKNEQGKLENQRHLSKEQKAGDDSKLFSVYTERGDIREQLEEKAEEARAAQKEAVEHLLKPENK